LKNISFIVVAGVGVVVAGDGVVVGVVVVPGVVVVVPVGAPVVIPDVVFDLQNGASGNFVQLSFFSDPASVGREPDGAPVVVVVPVGAPVVVVVPVGAPVVVPLVVDDLQNGASVDVLQISFLTASVSAGMEPDGALVVDDDDDDVPVPVTGPFGVRSHSSPMLSLSLSFWSALGWKQLSVESSTPSESLSTISAVVEAGGVDAVVGHSSVVAA
jgi:hypothetical protein